MSQFLFLFLCFPLSVFLPGSVSFSPSLFICSTALQHSENTHFKLLRLQFVLLKLSRRKLLASPSVCLHICGNLRTAARNSLKCDRGNLYCNTSLELIFSYNWTIPDISRQKNSKNNLQACGDLQRCAGFLRSRGATDIISGDNGQVSYKSTKTTPPPLPAVYRVQDASKQRKVGNVKLSILWKWSPYHHRCWAKRIKLLYIQAYYNKTLSLIYILKS